jgi:excisionase family DNA binding protein
MEREMERKALSVSEFSDALGTSNDTTRRRIADGSIRSVRFGRRVLIPRAELDRILAEGCGPRAQIDEAADGGLKRVGPSDGQ